MKKILAWTTLGITIAFIVFVQLITSYSESNVSTEPSSSLTATGLTTLNTEDKTQIRLVATEAGKLYLGAPGAKGTVRTLESLSRLVTDDLHRSLSEQWAGLDETEVRSEVTKLVVGNIGFSAAKKNDAYAEVTGDYTLVHASSESRTSYVSSLLLSFQKNDGKWLVYSIQPLS